MIRAMRAVFMRDLRLVFRQGADLALALAFFLIAASLFPLGVGPSPETLAIVASGVVWVLSLLSVMLSLDRLFQSDYDDGALELMAMTATPMALLVLAKASAHWVTTGLPLTLLAPVIAMMLNLPADGLLALVLGLLLGTPAMSLIGAIGAALVLGARRASLLTALLVLPLYIPVLIFGVSAVDAAVAGLPWRPYMLILAAISMASIPLAPWAAGAAVRSAFQ
ncbi:MAG: heme exporter protein CcmB [Alphaproteobacteria bacterium]|nr:heme exporter protein CcmB [Alphaproteobacteria bacterium]